MKSIDVQLFRLQETEHLSQQSIQWLTQDRAFDADFSDKLLKHFVSQILTNYIAIYNSSEPFSVR